MNKIIVVAVIVAFAASGFTVAYFLQFAPAVQAVEYIQEQVGGFTTGDLNFSTIASGASLATAATTAVGWIKSNKDKVTAQASAAKEALTNSEIMGQLNDIKSMKDSALSEVETIKGEVTKITQEKDSIQSELDKVIKEKTKLQNQIDALHNLIPDIKNNVVEKVIVK
jgi:DNA repair ATPase RecN